MTDGPWTLLRLEEVFPQVPWRLPQPVHTQDHGGFACRICVANKGLKADGLEDCPYVFRTKFDAQQHLREHYP